MIAAKMGFYFRQNMLDCLCGYTNVCVCDFNIFIAHANFEKWVQSETANRIVNEKFTTKNA